MIEQTEMVVSKWEYNAPAKPIDDREHKLTSLISLDIMRKRNSQKKGIACRLTCEFIYGNQTVLEFVGEDSYVIDFADVIDKKEILTMIRNSYSKFKEKFDLRKLGTVLQDKSLPVLNEYACDLDAVEGMLV